MRNFRDVPIQRKLRFVVSMTCCAALAVACAIVFALQFVMFRRDFTTDLTTTAEIIGRNSTLAMSWRDEETGRQTLAALHAKPHIDFAALVMRDGTRLASYGYAAGFETPAHGLQPGLSDDGRHLLCTHPIFLGEERLGTLFLRADYRTSYRQLMQLYGGVLGFVVGTSFLVAMFVSARLERLIVHPINDLAETAKRIAANNDYSVRAQKLGDDELGSFTDSFNSMLDQIHSRDLALRYEIAERKRTERELQKLHLRLVETSRQAGMAEVATGVLHNVGNVLNSVNVSATLIAERLSRTRTANLVRAAALLRSKNGSLAEFLTCDERGKVLPAYLADLGTHIQTERDSALAELHLLNRNLGHIKDIVSMQQSYARVSGCSELIAADALVEDALSLNAGSIERQGVKIVRKYSPVPAVAVDKHKTLQILVNVLRNATQSIHESRHTEKTVTIAIAQREAECVEIAITDTGIGIEPEDLTRIFSLGFTTRREGHGFGLHTAALAAQQMDGRLTATSAGRGSGATLTLELPTSLQAFTS